MTSPNPMALDAKALEGGDYRVTPVTGGQWARCAQSDISGAAMTWLSQGIAVRVELWEDALPPPAAGEGLEPVAWLGYWPGMGSVNSTTSTTHLRHEADRWRQEGAEITLLYSISTTAARDAVLDEALAIVSVGINALDGGVDAASRRYAAAINALKEKT